MESYFFVPGTRLHKLKKIENLKVSQIIIDLEDSVKFSERERVIDEIKASSDYKNLYIRVPLYNELDRLDKSIFLDLYNHGFNRFVFPKIKRSLDFESLMDEKESEDLDIILLVETIRFFFEIKDVLLENKRNISGIGVGSHDFIAEVGGVHNLKNLEYVRLRTLYLARMINCSAIDIASMELNSASNLRREILDGFEKGYNAKFFIHPWQIEVKNEILFYSEEDLRWATRIREKLAKANNSKEFAPIVIDGQIIERPHLNRVEKIIRYYESK